MKPLKEKLASNVRKHQQLVDARTTKLHNLRENSVRQFGYYVRTPEIAQAQHKLSRQKRLLCKALDRHA